MKQILSYLLIAFIGLSTASAKTDKQAKNILDKTAAVIIFPRRYTETKTESERENGNGKDMWCD